ncbi:phytoene/squalene synthase family protein [Halomicroarcula sp. F13]|uniref:Phytoene/squalene synthase family protein n=1 Tax=Haloarcula rubra TaxID=2487747 RepID=A0AAW4PLY2_9EURY|nr:phytoene/squalene synthase family protein [Halomicroarcula rubra]MBX0322151.1 phytoene/squalene synthase family protein [Halomicroarcula rubra]
MQSDNIRTSKSIQQQTGRTFHLATRVLPERIRYPTYVMYAFFRVADEVVDQPDGPPPNVQHERLETIRETALGNREPDDTDDGAVLAAFQDLREEHDIPDEEINVFIDAMEMDIAQARYETFEDLRGYMRGSAVAVGNMMTIVMDPPQRETALPHAEALAEAFQLSNFLRDVREDIHEYGRVYLPQETLERHGVTEEQLANAEVDDAFRAVMQEELARTDELYREGVKGISYLPDDCQFGVLLSAVLYAEHHRLIRNRGYDVLTETPELTRRRRLWLLARTWWHWRRNGDPEATFYAVSAVSERGPDTVPTDVHNHGQPTWRG